MSDEDVMQAYRRLRVACPDAAYEVMLEAATDAIPEDLTRLHVCVYDLMLAVPGLGSLDAIEILARTGILLHREEGEK